jgi:hypothetical protein
MNPSWRPTDPKTPDGAGAGVAHDKLQSASPRNGGADIDNPGRRRRGSPSAMRSIGRSERSMTMTKEIARL